MEIGTYVSKINMVRYSDSHYFNDYNEALKYYNILVKKGMPVVLEVGVELSLWLQSTMYREELAKILD